MGRLFSNGLQNAWSEVRGLLNKESTDIDMDNAHPRIAAWIAETNGIEATVLFHFSPTAKASTLTSCAPPATIGTMQRS